MKQMRNYLSWLVTAIMMLNLVLLSPAVAEASSYDSADRLTDPAVSYDENGNLLDDGTTAYIYDTANRLVQTAVGADTNAYTYDGLGNLVEISENGTATELVLNENTAYPTILGEIQGATTRSYAYGMGVHAQKTAGAVEYPLVDHQGTIRHMTDAAGTVTHSRYYNAWGETRHTTGGSGPTLGYTGEREMVDGTVHLRARSYQPEHHRFLQRDSIDPGLAGRGTQGHNRYSYVENNATNYVDPSGHLVLTEEDTTPTSPTVIGGGGLSTAGSGRGSIGRSVAPRGMMPGGGMARPAPIPRMSTPSATMGPPQPMPAPLPLMQSPGSNTSEKNDSEEDACEKIHLPGGTSPGDLGSDGLRASQDSVTPERVVSNAKRFCRGSSGPPVPVIKGKDYDTVFDGHHRELGRRLCERFSSTCAPINYETKMDLCKRNKNWPHSFRWDEVIWR